VLIRQVMTDPVLLPVSKIYIDKSTIRTVLLSKEADPFNNVPYVEASLDSMLLLTGNSLKFEDCLPASELKARIDSWVAEGKTKQADQVTNVDDL
jgi:ubiquitin conjugation factor E4 B